MAVPCKIGIGWQLAPDTGWGVVALNVALALAARPDVELTFWSADFRALTALDRARLEPALLRSQQSAAALATSAGPVPFDGVVFHALGNQVETPALRARIDARAHVGLMVFEDTQFRPDALGRLRTDYHAIATASRWNHYVLATHGIPSTLAPQGIDPTIFHPAPRSGRWRDRFVIYSGGKLEYRKGQDIVLRAFRDFHARHPDALLVTAWQNKWPALATDLTLGGHVDVAPEVFPNGVDLHGWFDDNGIPEGAALDVGILPNVMLGPIVREADVAVFASRAEGGTNLMAMEALACGVPTIVSHNTGHRDLRGVIPLTRQGPCPQPTKFFSGIDDWGESDPDEIVAQLELEYSIRRASPNRRIGAFDPAVTTWATHADQLVALAQGLA